MRLQVSHRIAQPLVEVLHILVVIFPAQLEKKEVVT